MTTGSFAKQYWVPNGVLANALIVLKICLFTLLPDFAFAQNDVEKSRQQMEKYIQERYEKGEFYGSVLVAKNGKVVYEAGMGLADSTWGIPNDTNVKYPLASITKFLTAMITMQLVAAGKIELSKSANDYLADDNLGLDSTITIAHLLSHRAGLADHVYDLSDDEYISQYGRKFVEPSSIVKDMTAQPRRFEAGASSYYSNTGYVVLGLIIESVTGKTFCQVLRNNIFVPAQMHDSGCLEYEAVIPRLATSYELQEGEIIHVPFDHSNFSDGFAYSTLRDMLKLDIALRNEVLLPVSFQNKMSEAQVFDEWVSEHYGQLKSLGYGYGTASWELGSSETQEALTVVGHGGAGWGLTSIYWRVPEQGVVVVAISNRSIWPFPVYAELVRLAIAEF